MSSPVPMLAPGTLVAGRYRVDSLLGKGGFGVVFAATQLPVNRQVALKMLLPHMAQGEWLERFQREAELAQRLDHPNVVRLLDFGLSESNLPFIVFELLKGQGLDAVIAREGGLAPARVARIGSQVLKALMEAHSQGIVHRDIKPANLFLSTFQGEPDFVKVLDFGIAKVQGAGGPKQQLTAFGQVLGTPSYMAPEQMKGKPATPAADLYALGLVLGEALSGQPVFGGAIDAEICLAQLSDAPVPLSPHVLRSPLGPVLLRATQKAPERRYASAAEMLAHIEEAMRGAGAAAQQAAGPSAPPSPGLGSMETRAVSYPAMSSPMGPPLATPMPGGMQGYPAPGMMAPPPGGYATPAPMGYPQAPPPMGYPQAPMGYPQAPMGYPQAPVSPQAFRPLPAKKGMSGGQGCVLAGVLGVCVLVALGFVVALGLERIGALPTTDDSSTTVASTGALKDLTAAALKQRIEKAGYSITGSTLSEQGALSVQQFTVASGQKGGSVMLYRFKDSSIAGLTAESLKKTKDAAVARDGDTLLFVLVVPANGKASQDLLDAVVKKR